MTEFHEPITQQARERERVEQDWPQLGSSGMFFGVALPERGMQDGALMAPELAIDLGRELIRLGEFLLAHKDKVLDDERERARLRGETR